MLRLFKLSFFSLLVSFLFSHCATEKSPVQLLRFDQDLFNKQSLQSANHYLKLQQKYGPFYETFAVKMLNISEEERPYAYKPSLDKFVNFPSIQQLKKEVDSVFPNLNNLEADLERSMDIYLDEFPKEKIPAFVTFISEFGFAHANLDTVVAIGLDMYLGANYGLYPALDFPEFMVEKLRKEYMLANTLKSLAIGKYEHQLRDKRFLAMMLFEGKMRYFIKTLAPQIPDSIIFGYSKNQLQWANENEAMIWAHLLESKMLFNQDPSVYMRYFNDGPFTIANGVPQSSAPAIGVYAGYKIIAQFMELNGRQSLRDLMENQSWDKILKESKYRPK
jgi:hypothetical protein